MVRLLLLVACVMSFPALAVETMRISMGEHDARVQLFGRELATGPDAEDAPLTPLASASPVVRFSEGRLEVEGVEVPGGSVRFRAGGEGKQAIKVGTMEVRGDVVVRVERGKLQLINVIPLEEYLAAVLGSEMPRAFPLEALKAQAVAARTYALHKKLESYGQAFHLGSSVLHQVYGGVAREDPRTVQAVEATRGEVLTFELAPVEAYFHASCGGQTESGLDALNRDLPYLQSVTCPCGKLPVTRWELTVPAKELKVAMGVESPSSLLVASRSSTGRVRRIRLTGSRSLDAVSFRAKLGYLKVKSLAFELEEGRDGAVKLSGHGFGHGAGLCQWGAKALADDGWDYRRILLHYYPGVEMQQLY
ncbi:MAG: SpoIID/LytB domain-containing protein [Myxococcaceae bacterium]